MVHRTELTGSRHMARAFRDAKSDGISIESRAPWAADAEVPEIKKKKYYFKKWEDPERMSMRALKEALCEYAGEDGERCNRCQLCKYGTQWIRRTAQNEA